jgi:hypothetical protein
MPSSGHKPDYSKVPKHIETDILSKLCDRCMGNRHTCGTCYTKIILTAVQAEEQGLSREDAINKALKMSDRSLKESQCKYDGTEKQSSGLTTRSQTKSMASVRELHKGGGR